MLRVTLEATRVEAGRLVLEHLGTIEIVNDGMGTPEHGSYVWEQEDAQGRRCATGRLRDYPRAQGAWTLVWAVLGQIQRAMPTGGEGEE